MHRDPDETAAFHPTDGAHIREVGFKFQRWIDVGYWQKIL